MGKKTKKDYSKYSIEALFKKLNKYYTQLQAEKPQLAIVNSVELSDIINQHTHAATLQHAVTKGKTKPNEQTSIATFCNWVAQLNQIFSPMRTQHKILNKIKSITDALYQKTYNYHQTTMHKRPPGGVATCLAIENNSSPQQKQEVQEKPKKSSKNKKYNTQSICRRLAERSNQLRDELQRCCLPWGNGIKLKKIEALDQLATQLKNKKRTCKTANDVSQLIKATTHDNPALTSGFFSRRTDTLINEIVNELAAPAA